MVLPDLVARGIQPDDGAAGVEGPLLPLVNLIDDLVGDEADGRGGDGDAAHVPRPVADVGAAQPMPVHAQYLALHLLADASLALLDDLGLEAAVAIPGSERLDQTPRWS